MQQLTWLKDIFSVTTDPHAEATYLPSLAKELKSGQLFVKNDNLFDSLLFERLSMPSTDILRYLGECWCSIDTMRGKPWYQHPQAIKFLDLSQERISNYTVLALQDRDMFPSQFIPSAQLNKISDPHLYSAASLIALVQRAFMPEDLLHQSLNKMRNELPRIKACLIQQLMMKIRDTCVLQNNANKLLNFLMALIKNEEFRKQLVTMSRLKLESKSALELQSRGMLCGVLRMSLLGYKPSSPMDAQNLQRLSQKYAQAMQTVKYQKQFQFLIKQIQQRQNQINQISTEIFKMLLKRDTQKEFLHWLSDAILLLHSRTKEGHMYFDNASSGSDGAALIIFDAMLQISKVIIDPNNGKQNLIDPEYLICHRRYKKAGYQPLNNSLPKHMEIQKQFGTVSQFFFASLELLAVSLLPTMNNLIKLHEHIVKFEKQVKKQLNPKQYEQEKRKIEGMYLQYMAVLSDQKRARLFVKLTNSFLSLLPKWLGIDLGRMEGGVIPSFKSNNLEGVIPELFILAPLEVLGIYASFIDTLSILNLEESYSRILDLTCILLSNTSKISSNPHIAAKLIETVFKIAFANKKTQALCQQIIKNHEVSQHNLAHLIVQFYINVAFSIGSAYYMKYQYRHYSNQILKTLCKFQVYRNSIKSFEKEELFKRFLNMLVSDINFMLQEAEEPIKKYIQAQNSPPSEEDNSNNQNHISYLLHQLSDNIRLISEFSAWSGSSFLSEQLMIVLVPMLNGFMKTIIDPSNNLSKKSLMRKFKFKNQFVLKDILTVITNFSHDKEFINQIIKDQRSYSIELFISAKTKAQEDNATPDDVIIKFSKLIQILAKSVDLDQLIKDFPEEYSCKLLFTLLKDPVMLPTSKNVVQRSTIHSHLFNDQRDPFNRQPLKLSDLIEMPELKQEIQVWKGKKLQQILSKKKRADQKKLQELTEDNMKVLRFQ